ncbi:serine-rich adhesin for platelets [Drosophila sulfurigaster albostrigata]|uniref:serine-rich adhesin for platelets n=1 Tax=Drosophila sulfurigaster albostrigata TaxID=89887 RepID=UPI002D21E757|nr:serine-rich adhesin for platelets [Drosophila sulfurigaster albostrigata]
MVNELNKPQDNSALSELLAASNRQLQEMQEEHRQLQEELSRLSVQRQQLRQATREHHSQVTSSSTSTVVSSSGSQIASESLSATDEAAAVQQTDAASAVGEEEDNEETANYLQEKLAEIANLKAQFKRVQNITDSTKLIEQHLSSVESQSSSTVMKSKQTKTMESIQSSSSTSSTSTSRSAQSLEAATSATSATSEARATPDNAELLNAMINMVTDFTSDLRGQEESLRAERLRIKSLKEEIIQRKQSKE